MNTDSVSFCFTVAVDKLPNFLASPTPDGKPGPHHQCSIHLNCESVELLETAYKEAMNGRPSARYIQYISTMVPHCIGVKFPGINNKE